MRVYGRGVLFVSGSIAAEDGAISGFSFTLSSALVTPGDLGVYLWIRFDLSRRHFYTKCPFDIPTATC